MRIMLYLATNMAVLALVTVVMSIFGVEPYLNEAGLNLQSLLIFCAVFGFAGSFVSLAMSKWAARRATGARIIDPQDPGGEPQQWLLNTVEDLAREARIGMPEVAIFPADAPNAFATGARRNSALVAVSAGMLQSFPRDEVRAVMAHEIGHVANGDMVTMSLLQGVLNTFVMFFARIIGYAVDRLVFRNQQGGLGPGYFLTVLVAQIALGILAQTIVMWFSRRREFRADAWGARLGGTKAMVSALERLRRGSRPGGMPDALAAFGISSSGRNLAHLFSSHPPIEARIEALQNADQPY